MNLLKLIVRHPISKIPKRCKHCYNPIVCDVPVRPIIVTIIGSNSRVGRILALLLKQCSLIDTIRLFDYEKGPKGNALDLSHIDTNTDVKDFTGLEGLGPAISGAKVVVVCGGDPIHAHFPQEKLFYGNADHVRNAAVHTAEFSPSAIFCICTPPVTAMVPLASEEYKKASVYDARKIIGVTALSVIRGNSIVAAYGETDPVSIMCPVVGGFSQDTTVAVVSQTKIGQTLPSPVADVLRSKIARAENDVLTLKYVENGGSCCVSSAFAAGRFIPSVVRGLLGLFDGVECGFVRQRDDIVDFLPYMTSLIEFGRHGVSHIHMPKLDNFECIQLQRAADIIRRQIEWGEGYITGKTTKKKHPCSTLNPPRCDVVQLKHIARVGDVTFDPSPAEAGKMGKLVPK